MVDMIGDKLQPGADLSLKIINNNNNIASTLITRLYQAYADECRENGRTRTVFRPGLAYDFSPDGAHKGLVFRIRSGDDQQDDKLEFYVPDEGNKQAALLTITSLLRQAGIKDEGTLRILQEFIKDKNATYLDTIAQKKPFTERLA